MAGSFNNFFSFVPRPFFSSPSFLPSFLPSNENEAPRRRRETLFFLSSICLAYVHKPLQYLLLEMKRPLPACLVVTEAEADTAAHVLHAVHDGGRRKVEASIHVQSNMKQNIHSSFPPIQSRQPSLLSSVSAIPSLPLPSDAPTHQCRVARHAKKFVCQNMASVDDDTPRRPRAESLSGKLLKRGARNGKMKERKAKAGRTEERGERWTEDGTWKEAREGARPLEVKPICISARLFGS